MNACDVKIPQVFPLLGEEEIEEVTQVIRDNWLTEGPRSKQFSECLNQLIGSPYGVFAPNGTLALALGLMGLGIGQGDEVIVPDCTFIGSANAVIMVGATPVLAEVNDRNCQIDVSKASNLVTARTKAIMPVHLYGMSSNMDEVMTFADAYGLKVIEDAAQGIGVYYRDRHVGTIGDVGCFSFFADKTITTGEGGYVTTRSKEVYERLLLLRNQGRLDRGTFIHPAVGYNYRITDLQAAVGLVQLKRLPEIVRRKTENFGWYKDGLKNVEEVRFIEVERDSTYVPFRTVLFVDDAQKLMQYLESHGVQTRSFFYPLHKQPCFAPFDRAKGGAMDLEDDRFPNANAGYEHGLCLPIYPALQESQVAHISDVIKDFLSHA